MTRALLVLLAVLLVSGGVNYCQYQESGSLNAKLVTARDERDSALEDARLAHNDLTIANNSSRSFHDELDQLKSAAARKPAPRVDCVRRSAAANGAVPDASAAAGTSPASPATGVLPSPDGRTHDIGPPLFELADQCDGLSAQLRAYDQWVSDQIAARNGSP